MAHPIHKHMHTHITKQNVKAAIRDDKAHMDYLKRDIKDDAKGKGVGNKEWETADEKHITHLAEDVKYDEKKEGISRMESASQERENLMKYNPVDDHAGISRKDPGVGALEGFVQGGQMGGERMVYDVPNPMWDEKAERKHGRKVKRATRRLNKGKSLNMKRFGPEVIMDAMRQSEAGQQANREFFNDAEMSGPSRKISERAAKRKQRKGKGNIHYAIGGGYYYNEETGERGYKDQHLHGPGGELNRGVYVSNKGKKRSIR